MICSNRIARVAAEGAATAASSRETQRVALQRALSGLASARASIAAAAMNDADRREALADIAQGEAEVRAEIAKAD